MFRVGRFGPHDESGRRVELVHAILVGFDILSDSQHGLLNDMRAMKYLTVSHIPVGAYLRHHRLFDPRNGR